MKPLLRPKTECLSHQTQSTTGKETALPPHD
jgi:hypothetical protein